MSEAATALRVPGRLCYRGPGDDWDFSAAFPHGGTSLGDVQAVELRERESNTPLRAEDWGVSVEVLDWLEAGIGVRLFASLRGANDDAISVVYRNTITGAVSGKKVALHPGTRVEGALRGAARAVQIVFSPDDPEHPGVYFPRALPILTEDRVLMLGRREERIVRVAFEATRGGDTAGDAWQVGQLVDFAEIVS